MQTTNLPIKKSRFNLLKSIILGLIIQISTLFSAFAITPVVNGIYPTSGEINGSFSLLGSNFADVEFIYFKDNNGNIDYTTGSINSNFLEVQYPSSMRNGVLTLTGTFGSYITSTPFTLATPSISSINPLTGTSSNGRVTVFGSNMRGIDKVYFTSSDGNEASSNFPTNFGNYIRINFIPSNAALGVFTLTGGFGTVISTINYSPPIPSISSINPLEGTDENSTITLFGSNLNAIQKVFFRSTNQNSAEGTVNYSTNYITVGLPQNANSGNLTLTGGFGTVTSSISYIKPVPTITGIFPTKGLSANGSLTLFGNNLRFIDEVCFPTVFGGRICSNFTNEGNHLKITDFANSLSQGPISISGSFGIQQTNYNYNILIPTITGIFPTTGTDSEGFITLTGSNLVSIQTINFPSGNSAGKVNEQDIRFFGTYIRAFVSSNSNSGVLSFTGVQHGERVSTISFVKAFNFPTVTGITPTFGIDASGNVELTGSFLTSIQSVYFVSSLTGTVEINNVAFLFSKLVVYSIPNDAISGPISISGTGYGITATNIQFKRFAPTLVSVTGFQSSLSLANIVNDALITLTGSGFMTGANVTIGGVVLTNVSVSGSVITGVIPVGSVVANPTIPSIIIQNPGLEPSVGITPIGIDIVNSITFKDTLKDEILIYPNPSNGEFSIKSPLKSNIQLINPRGEIIKELITNSEITKMIVSQKGLYILKIISNNDLKVIKVIIE